MSIETDKSLSSTIDDLISLIQDTINEGKKDGRLIPQKMFYQKWILNNFKYTDNGVEYGGAGTQPFTRNEWSQAKLVLEDYLKKSQKYQALCSKLKSMINGNSEKLFHIFASKLMQKLLDGKSSSDIQQLKTIFIKEIKNKPIVTRVSNALVGIVIRSPKIVINDSISLRQVQKDDLETETDIYMNGFMYRHPRPSAFLEIEGYTTDSNLYKKEQLSIVILRLFKVGSVKSIQSKKYSEHLAQGLETSYSNVSTAISNVMLIKEDEEQALRHFWQSIENYIPKSFVEYSFSDSNFSDIAHRRYIDALLKADTEEFRIANTMMGLESIFLKDDGELQELSYRLRLRVAKIMSNFGYDPFETSKIIKDAYQVRSSFVHGGLLSYKNKKKLVEKYKSMNNLIEKLLDFLRLSIITSITVNVSKEELIDTIDDSFLDSKSQERLAALTYYAKDVMSLNKNR